MKKFEDFYKLTNGKGYDIDGYYGYQCWDGFAKYCKWLGYPVFNCTTTGYAVDIWNNRKTSGILKYFEEVKPNSLKKGDVIIWKRCPEHPDSHIAIFDAYSGDKSVYSYGQNQSFPSDNVNGGHTFNDVIFSTSGLVGGLRPKNMIAKPKKPTYYTSKNVTKIMAKKDCYIYKKPKQNKKERVKKVKKGQVLEVSGIVQYKSGVSRFKVKGGYITGNQEYVSSVYYLLEKYGKSKTIQIKKTCYLYDDKNFKKRIRKLKKGEKVTIVDNVKSSGKARRLKTFNGNYITAHKEFSKWI